MFVILMPNLMNTTALPGEANLNKSIVWAFLSGEPQQEWPIGSSQAFTFGNTIEVAASDPTR